MNAKEADAVHSSRQQEELRTELEKQVAEFLSKGGQIKEIDDNVRADPPKKPESNYGGHSI